jgi:hypothetical protein
MPHRRLPIFATAAVLLTAAAAQATRPQTWTFTSQKDFAEGQFENTVVNSYGELTLGRTLTPIPTDPGAESVQAFAQTPDGAIYVATSPKAKIYRIDGNKTSVIYTAEKGFDDITAMTVDAKGNLLVALSGETAKLLSITPDGKTQTSRFQQADVDYIWAIQLAADGSLYLGTGPHGKVYKVPPGEGAPTLVLETGQKNVTALAWDANKNLVAGTDARGLVIRLDAATSKPFVLLDAGKVDINGIVSDPKGNLYVATAKAEPVDSSGGGLGSSDASDAPETKSKPSTPEKEPIEPPATPGEGGGEGMSPQGRGPDFSGIRVILGAAAPDLPADLKALLKKAAAQSPTKMTPSSKQKPDTLPSRGNKATDKLMHSETPDETEDTSTVYKITPDGIVSTLLQNPGLNYSLLLTGNELLIGTGEEGKLYAYQLHDESTTLVARVKEQQISTLFADRTGAVFLGTGNMAQVYQIGNSLSDTGTFTSQVLDASHTAFWGHALLQAQQPDGTKVVISTRTGNTQDVDANPKFWSDWSEVADHSAIASPSARFLQFRITLQGDGKLLTPTMNNLRIAYQTQNLPPRIKSVSLELPGTGTADDDSPDTGDDTSSSPPPTAEKPLHIAWDATDPNGDGLLFRLYYKQVTGSGEQPDLWTPLARNLKDSIYEWDTRSVPDGKYQVKLVASDSPDNPSPTALETARTSAPFVINHTPPVLSALTATVEGNKATVTGKATDGLSAVTDVRYRVDGQINEEMGGGGSEDWQPAAASDKIFDSPEEGFILVTRPLSTGPHRITVRATDAAGNNSYKAVTIDIKS